MNLLAAFLLGLAGSLHCAVMCGPLLLAVKSARQRDRVNSGTRFFSGNMVHDLSYQAGRVVTYSLLGAISGLIGGAIVFAGFQRWLSLAAGGVVLWAAFTSFRSRWAGMAVLAVKTRFSRLLGDRTLRAATLLGGLNGLLPCGLVYVACAAAAAAGGIGGGILTMLAFGLGTMPMMLLVGLAGKVIHWSNPFQLRRVVLVCAALAGVLLILRGLSLGIPYLSPEFSGGHGPTCHCHPAV